MEKKQYHHHKRQASDHSAALSTTLKLEDLSMHEETFEPQRFNHTQSFSETRGHRGFKSLQDERLSRKLARQR